MYKRIFLPGRSTSLYNSQVWYRDSNASRHLIIAVSRQCSLSMFRSRLAKASNLLLTIAFSRFCQGEFVYDTGSV